MVVLRRELVLACTLLLVLVIINSFLYRRLLIRDAFLYTASPRDAISSLITYLYKHVYITIVTSSK